MGLQLAQNRVASMFLGHFESQNWVKTKHVVPTSAQKLEDIGIKLTHPRVTHYNSDPCAHASEGGWLA